ncbi:hypothetical protein F2Q69_00015107 [Brassica cretica]|uniref:Uncharacterized protein n=1 Tax=Brassica cretica TaxID=69181 RepID=A0A8S9QR54_BRACR|nr:hypothetical protein F2Q69_00015107 [Brassica cretica]
MMQTVWGALAKIRCPPTPSCCCAPQTSEAAGSTGWIDRLVYRSIDPDGSDITVC